MVVIQDFAWDAYLKRLPHIDKMKVYSDMDKYTKYL